MANVGLGTEVGAVSRRSRSVVCDSTAEKRSTSSPSTRIARSASAPLPTPVIALLRDADPLPVDVEDFRCPTDRSDAASVEPDGPLAQPGDLVEIVAHEHHGRPGADE